ncbi:MAG: T9SS type B sorting domain-containing protein [Flavobacteriaceae bacterium]
MKKRLFLLLFIASIGVLHGQINISTGGTVTTCSDVFVDSGGLGGNYSSNENYEITICPDTAGNYLQLDFTTINIEGGFDDFLIVYNGNSSSEPIFGTINDDNTCDITQYTSSAVDGCLTIVFESDNSFNQSGWEANISCTTTPGGGSIIPENAICGGSGAFCADAGALEFPNSSDNDCVPDAPNVVVTNSCLGSAPNPAWYFVEIGLAGDIIIDIAQTTGPGGTGAGLDVDYVVWGPFPDVASACVDFTTGDCSGDHNCMGTAVDCSYSTAPVETATIPNAQVGEFYMFLITNFDGAAGYITLTQTNLGNPGAGSTDCCPYITGVNPSTCGANDGSIEISLLTPNTVYTITYNDPAPQTITTTSNALGEIVITGLAAGTYTNIYTNTPACNPEDITLVDAAAPVVNSLTAVTPICSGANADFTITGTPNAVVSYTINGGATATVTLDGTGNATISVGGVTSDTVIVLSDISLNSCTTVVANTTTVIVDPVPVLNSLTSNSPLCTGQDAIYTINGSPNAILTYNINGGAATTITLDASGNASITVPGIIVNTTLNLMNIALNACSSALTDTETVIIDPVLVVSSLVGNGPICEGDDAVFTVVGSPNSIVTYSINGGAAQTINLDALGNGVITVVGVTANVDVNLTSLSLSGCSVVLTNTATVVVTPNSSLTSLTAISPVCIGDDAVFNFVGTPNATVTYTINGGAPVLEILDALGNGTVTVTNILSDVTLLASGITINGCTVTISESETVIATAIPTLAITAYSNPTTCAGTDGSITLATTNLPDGTYTLNYEDAAATPLTMTMIVSGGVGTVTGLLAGIYNNIAVTYLGCISIDNVNVQLTDPPLPTLNLSATSNPTTCSGTNGSITLNTTNLPDGNYTVNYVDNTGTAQTEIMVVTGGIGVISNVSSGEYNNITVTHLNCTSVDDVDVLLTDPPLPVLTINATSNPTTCDGNDGSITLNTTNLPDGIYTVNYEDTTGTQQAVSMQVTGGIGIINGLYEGEYNNITITNNNCTSIDDVDVLLSDPLPSILAIIATSNPTICEGIDGSITLSTTNLPDGIHTINYEDIAGVPQTTTISVTANIGVITGLSAGTYNNITVTFLSCTSVEDIDVVLVDPLPAILAIIASANPTTCDGTDGSITLSTANLPDGTYTINYEDESGAPQTESIVVAGDIGIISGLSEGEFNNITVTYLSCTSVEDIDVELIDPIPAIIAVISVVNPSGCNANDGSITLSVANLIDGVYTVHFDDVNGVQQTSTITVVNNEGTIQNLPSGVYNNITIISASCESVEDVDVVLSDPVPAILAIISAANPTTCAGADGDIVLSTLNLPDGIYTINYEDASGLPQTVNMTVVANVGAISNLLSGSYNNITVTHVGCTSSEDVDVVLVDPSPPVLNDMMNMVPICETDTVVDGVMPHDLTLNIPSIISNQTGIEVTFYEQLSDAQTGTNPITNDTAYVNTNPTPPVSVQTIYVRGVDQVTGCFSVVSFTITVMSTEAEIPNPLTECDDDNDGYHYFVLHNTITLNEITNGNANIQVSYYETLAQANAGITSAQLSSPYQNITAYNQTVYARAQLITYDCYRIVELELNVTDGPALPQGDLLYSQCETSGSVDGIVTFDLTSYELSDLFAVIIANGGDVSNYTVNYYTGLNASGEPDLATLINNPSNFQNTVAPNQTIYASVTDTVTGCVSVQPIILHVDLLPEANYTEKHKCDDEVADGLTEFNLTEYSAIITGGSPNVDVVFYTNQTDAEAGSGNNIITNPTSYVNTINPQSVFVRVFNSSTECYEVALLVLHVDPLPTPLNSSEISTQLGNNGVMEVCDGNVDGSGSVADQVAEFDLTLWESQILTGDGPGVESGVSASYYTSYNDAVLQEQMISTPTTYTNLSNPQTIYVRVTNDGTGIIPATEGSGCFVILEFQIYVPIPQVIVLGNTVLCIDENGVPIANVPLPILQAEVTPSGPYNYQWSLNDVTIPGATNQSYTVTQAGEYMVTVSGPTNFNCINYASVIVEESGVPDNFNANVTTHAFADSHQIVAEATSSNPNIEFLYALDEAQGGEFVANGVFNNVSPGIHVITITDSRGCWKETISILVIDYPKFFTPNGDGVNDTWQIIGIEGIPISIIYIFDRYGKLLKQLDPNSIGWDGTYNGNQLPASDYWFTIKYLEGTPPVEKEFKAHFSLKR